MSIYKQKHHMKRFLFFGFLLICSIVDAQSILTDPDLKIWLTADSALADSNGLVSNWPDASGNNHDFYQNSISQQPILSSSHYFAHNSVLNFDGSNDNLQNNIIDSINLHDLSIFIVSSGFNQSGNMAGLFCVNNPFVLENT